MEFRGKIYIYEGGREARGGRRGGSERDQIRYSIDLFIKSERSQIFLPQHTCPVTERNQKVKMVDVRSRFCACSSSQSRRLASIWSMRCTSKSLQAASTFRLAVLAYPWRELTQHPNKAIQCYICRLAGGPVNPATGLVLGSHICPGLILAPHLPRIGPGPAGHVHAEFCRRCRGRPRPATPSTPAPPHTTLLRFLAAPVI